jgi:hypothetical protein
LESAGCGGRQRAFGEPLAVVALGSERDFSVDHNERDRLRELRGSLPREVTVIAPEHPLAGCRLAVEGHRRVGGVECLMVRLPDGSPGTVALSATSAGVEAPRASGGAVLSVEGVRRLRARLERRLGDGSGT